MTAPVPSQILTFQPQANVTLLPDNPKSSTGWTIFWLLAFTPIGWYFVWHKTSWPTWVKAVVTVLTLLAVIALLIETELIASQVAALSGIGF